MKDPAWKQIDDGLVDLMDNNDSLTLSELGKKSQRLWHLEKFVKTLKMRVNEAAAGSKVGDIGKLFHDFVLDRNAIDLQN